MESTGVYWIPLFQILEERGFKVYLVNAHSLKTVPPEGQLSPAEDICAVRTLWRHAAACCRWPSNTRSTYRSLSA